MADIILFGGTTEGRIIVERFNRIFARTGVKMLACVATEYGASLIKQSGCVQVRAGRIDADEMKQLIQDNNATLCIDATHPYAVDVTANIEKACKDLSIACVRVVRDKDSDGAYKEAATEGVEVQYVDSVKAAVEFLIKRAGNVFITTGSKELEEYTRLPDYRSRCTARVLSTAPVVENCARLGFEGRNLIAMQGPFAEELNYAMLRQTNADWLVTKNSGKEGGYAEKCEACIRAGVNIVVVGQPKETSDKQVGIEECIDILVRIYKTR